MFLNTNPHFAATDSLCTFKGAEKRLTDAFGDLDVPAYHALRITHFVIQRAPREFVPVVVITDRSEISPAYFAGRGIYVTN